MKLKAAPEPVSVVFDDLAPGIYAVGTYHDENNNGRLDFPVDGEDPHVTLRIKY
jgi:uncharacterized protein (DUF2141 family)